jgi:hypothetical protein
MRPSRGKPCRLRTPIPGPVGPAGRTRSGLSISWPAAFRPATDGVNEGLMSNAENIQGAFPSGIPSCDATSALVGSGYSGAVRPKAILLAAMPDHIQSRQCARQRVAHRGTIPPDLSRDRPPVMVTWSVPQDKDRHPGGSSTEFQK